MKYISILSLFFLVGAGCTNPLTAPQQDSEPQVQEETQQENVGGGVSEKDVQQTVAELQTTWQEFRDAAQLRDCVAFNDLLTQRQKLSEKECETAFDAFAAGVPPIQWDLTEVKQGMREARVLLSKDRALTTFIKNTDGSWQADTKFWPGR